MQLLCPDHTENIPPTPMTPAARTRYTYFCVRTCARGCVHVVVFTAGDVYMTWRRI